MQLRFTPPNILIIKEDISAKFERYYLLSADRHIDNPKSDRELQRRHLEWAKTHDAKVLDFGDLFCAMQGRNDPRRDRASIIPKHNRPGYYDAIVNDAVEFFSPYRDQILLLAMGNHETSVLKNAETNLTERLAHSLRAAADEPPYVGGYSGYIRFSFAYRCPNSTGRFQSFDMFYHHGFGGGGAVTRGTIQHARRASTYDADIIVSGHVHEAWMLNNMRVSLNAPGTEITKRKQLHICIPTYKDDFGDGAYGWATERGMPPKPTGAVGLKFFWCQQKARIDFDAFFLT